MRTKVFVAHPSSDPHLKIICGICLAPKEIILRLRTATGIMTGNRDTCGRTHISHISVHPAICGSILTSTPPYCPLQQLGAKRRSGNTGGGDSQAREQTARQTPSPPGEVVYPYASGSGSGNRTLDILAETRSRGAAVGAFTVYNMEGIQAVIAAADATGRSAILQVQ